MVFRRGNKSHKVPNVILRPADPSSSKRVREAGEVGWNIQHRDIGFDSEPEPTFNDVCPRPFRGVVLCATGIDDKTAIFKQAIELGAQSLNDLTDKVTHLLAVEPGSAKYKCALDCGLPIMHPSWITDSYQVWLRGDDVNVDESVRLHRLPVFSGVVLCISGIEDVHRREEINRLVTKEGGTYVKNIERPVKVTHLLCSTGLDEISEKMKYAEKFNSRKEANISMVWEDWLWDCFSAKGRLDEELYSVSNPRPAPRATQEPVTSPPSTPPLERDSAQPEDRGSSQHRQHTNFESHEHEEEELVSLKRVPAVTLQIWGGMLKHRGFEVTAGKLVRSPSKSQAPPLPAHLEKDSPTKSRPKPKPLTRDKEGSMLASFRRSHSFAPTTKDTSTQRRPFGRMATLPDAALSTLIGEEAEQGRPVASASRPSLMAEDSSNELKSGIFSEKIFRVVGEARCQTVKLAVEEAGGKFVPEDSDEFVDYVVVRLVSGSKLFREETDEEERRKYRTECWLERCIFEERICSPNDHVSFTPLRIETPVSGAERINLSISGLEESEACWVRRLVRVLGINLAPNFSRRSTHLLCPSRTGAKFDKAQDWNIPVVDMSWLRGIAVSGLLPGVQESSTDVGVEESHINGHIEPISPNRDPRGKGKARAVDQTMADITNNDAMTTAPMGSTVQPRIQSSPLDSQDYFEPFAEPTGLLNTPAVLRQPSKHSLPPLPNSITALPPIPHISRAPSNGSETQLSLAELREDMKSTIIRSSASPSPMKAPSKPASPVKISTEAAKELQDSLTSILGKRMSGEEESLDGQPARPKRARPPSRSKLQLKADNLPAVQKTDGLPSPEPEKLARQSFDPFPAGDEDISMFEEDELNVHVTYEDPAQVAVKQKLMKLLDTQKQEGWEVGDESISTTDGSASLDSTGTTKQQKRRKPQPRRRSTRIGGL